MKKFIVLGVLFILPITIYIFFASGKDNFARLPVLNEGVVELNNFKTIDGASVALTDHITVLGFFGNNLEETKSYAFNLAHKIYKKNQGFKDFQMIILLPEGTQESAKELNIKLSEITTTENWKFVFGASEEIQKVFNSLQSNKSLNGNLATPYVSIIDKDRNLRGRNDDEDFGMVYSYNASDIAEINNKMSDDIKVLLAEYRLALKKNKATRKI
ncbi:hypothetical protein [Ulvibacter litoralis]|uniref:Uncharacterized protein n=1 Tax=Ulvibacter litoralis TaxID=227084 RepID=A0A1G7DVE6_9FLAO|nr:hypothetical protein [Ulvibacter litoralis]GHC42107.1 hypothetical protein GCM10008083_00150 [Ulvibacter litoralis]SDE55467.1 hypothetical protein SAMN05421855_1011199 [Ulvibacter litoralis]